MNKTAKTPAQSFAIYLGTMQPVQVRAAVGVSGETVVAAAAKRAGLVPRIVVWHGDNYGHVVLDAGTIPFKRVAA